MTHWKRIAETYDPLKAGSIDGTDVVPHDRAIFRAMNAKYKPNKHVVGVPEHTIFVGRLSPNTDEEALEDHFREYGDIKRLRLVRDIVTGFSRCYAFIEFCDERTAGKAQERADRSVLDEKEIYVDYECERTLKGWIPRRLGGGISGQKESGQLRFGGKNKPFKRPFNINEVEKPQGQSFRERLDVVEQRDRNKGGHESSRHRDRYDKYRRTRSRSRDRSSRSYRSRSRSRERSSRKQRSRSKTRQSHSRNERSNARDTHRSRSRSRDRSRRY